MPQGPGNSRGSCARSNSNEVSYFAVPTKSEGRDIVQSAHAMIDLQPWHIVRGERLPEVSPKYYCCTYEIIFFAKRGQESPVGSDSDPDGKPKSKLFGILHTVPFMTLYALPTYVPTHSQPQLRFSERRRVWCNAFQIQSCWKGLV